MRTSWNRREHEALRGLSLLAKTLYLLVFRHRMDNATGIAGGAVFPITDRTVLTELEFLPAPGSTRARQLPSKGEVRAAIRSLGTPDAPQAGSPSGSVAGATGSLNLKDEGGE